MKLDRVDQIAAEVFDGYLVRKDLVRHFNKQFPVPTYVVEFLLGRYCATTDEGEIAEGLELTRKTLEGKAVSGGNEELFKARARENGEVKVIDLITAKLDAAHDVYVANLPSLQMADVRISPELVQRFERMLTGGFYADVTLEYDPAVPQSARWASPFGVKAIREIQLAQRDVLETLGRGRKAFTTAEWKAFLLRSAGYEPEAFPERGRDMLLLRMVPLVERNYNLIEFGPRGTGKSHVYQQLTPYAHLLSGGTTSMARLFVNLGTGQRGLVCHYDAVCFDEIAGIVFEKKNDVNIMKSYMESGEFSRGKESIRADGGLVFVGNYEVDMEEQKRKGHLLKPLPEQMRDDTAFMDRLHAFLPGWDVPKMDARKNLTSHFGLVSDFLAEAWHQLRLQSRVAQLRERVRYGAALSGRDAGAVNATAGGLLKLISPDISAPVAEEDVRWAVELALEVRERVKEQQKAIGKEEYRDTAFGYFFGDEKTERKVFTAEGDHGALPQEDEPAEESAPVVAAVPAKAEVEVSPIQGGNGTPEKAEHGPEEKQVEVAEGQTGIDFGRLFGAYLKGAKAIDVVDPYIRNYRQCRNFMELMETVLRNKEDGDEVVVRLTTVSDPERPEKQDGWLQKIQSSCAGVGIKLEYTYTTANIHDRIIDTDTGWRILPGRGLDIYQAGELNEYFAFESHNPSRRPCRAFIVTYVRRPSGQ